jgi:hypothetical protein
MAASDAYEQFVNDDGGYLRWMTENPLGFVVNSHRTPTSDYLILHRASCAHISTPNRTNWTTAGFIKTCSPDRKVLDEWATREIGGALSPCGSCKPDDLGAPGPQTSDRPIDDRTMVANDRVVESPGTSPAPGGRRSLPPEISTGCPELDRAWAAYAAIILDRSQILIPDTDDDLAWHAFLGHSLDMQGFRAAEFAGIDPPTRKAPGFVPLKARGVGVPELASLWDALEIRQHLLSGTRGLPFQTTLGVLRASGGEAGASLAEAFEHFPWRKFHWCVRALLQNSAVLKPFACSFRGWLRHECDNLGVGEFPPADFRRPVALAGTTLPLERALRARLERTFYMVGPAMSSYMVCDWQLWLWREGKTAVFANFKLDSFHEAFVKKCGRGVVPADEAGFAGWWLGLYPDLPPRLANECIWLAVEDKKVDLR